MMDTLDVEENLLVAGDAKLHGEMFRVLVAIVCKVLEIFPFIEAARPRSKSGIQALCSLHIALDKSKSLLQHCSDCSKLYLAITGDSILMKFEKAKCALQESLRRVEDIVPEAIGCQIMEIVGELDEAVFVLDESEKHAGEELISLLQKERKLKTSANDGEEIEVFHQAAVRLGITSSRAALTERRALKKLIERARAEDDKRKESIVSYLYHLMRKYSKLFRSEFADDVDSQGSAPCSPTVIGLEEASCTDGRGNNAFERQLSKLRSFNFKENGRMSTSMPIPPEEFRCPISLQLMYDPVIISSGQTYERACIEKWFNDGHSTCPKTQQQLSHLCLTPNYCVKGLITSWCEQNGIPVPDGPPDSLNVNYWRLAYSQREAMDSISLGSSNSCKKKGINVVSMDHNGAIEEDKEYESETFNYYCQDSSTDEFERYQSLLAVLHQSSNMQKQRRAVEQIRYMLKDNEEARIFMGDNGFVDALVQFMKSALQCGDEKAQEAGAMALFNLAVDNNRNKQMLVSAGLLPIIEQMISNCRTFEPATAVYLNLSCLEEAKPIIGSSQAVAVLVEFLQAENSGSNSCKHDVLYTLYNLSTHPPNIPLLLSTGIVDNLQFLLSLPSGAEGNSWAEKALAILINLASIQAGREEIVSAPGIISGLAEMLDIGDPVEQEQAVSCLYILCSNDELCIQMVLQEGAIPSLVSISVNGTTRGKEKAQKLLKLFREQRQRESSPIRQRQQQQQQATENNVNHRVMTVETKSLCKSKSRKLGRALSSIWRNKSFSVYQC